MNFYLINRIVVDMLFKIRAELEKMDLFVRTCQLATTREPGKILGWDLGH